MSATTVPSVTVPTSEVTHRPTAQTPVRPTNPVKPVTTASAPRTRRATATYDRPETRGTETCGAEMYDRARACTWADLVAAVQDAGQYPTAAEAERVTRTVLAALGGHVVGDERVDLARVLPREAARLLADQIPATRRLTAAQFVDSVAARTAGATTATARWDVSSVLSVLPPLLGDALTTRILAQLPPGYALLFGRADLSRTA